MDSINKIINFLFPLLTLYALLVFYPTYQRLKSAVSICRNLFSENVAGKVVVITGAASGIGEVSQQTNKQKWWLGLCKSGCDSVCIGFSVWVREEGSVFSTCWHKRRTSLPCSGSRWALWLPWSLALSSRCFQTPRLRAFYPSHGSSFWTM